MNPSQSLGLFNTPESAQAEQQRLQLYINLKLASSGQPVCALEQDAEFLHVAHDLLQSYQEKSRLLSDYLCPADWRIQTFLDTYLEDLDLEEGPRLPSNSIVLDRHGVARELSLPLGRDRFESDIVTSYRVRQGVLHNPASDRRTTKGSFHIAQGGLPIPGDKKAVPKRVFANLLREALNPPRELLLLPFSSARPEGQRAHMFVSLLLRPLVCPEIPGKEQAKRMEIRFFAPGNLVSNLDFVESIFGNAGNPHLPQHDAGLDTGGWSGHSGCVILAPHLIRFTKKQLGLPHWDDASELQRADGMCWRSEEERYNDGNAFKITARDGRGVIVTVIADNYYGYCKKEVKTQIGYAANLYGLAEEEHAGGALAFPCHNHGVEYGVDSRTRSAGHSFAQVQEMYGELMEIRPEGYGIDKRFPKVIYVPQELRMDLDSQTISWLKEGERQSIPLRPGEIYLQPNGYRVEMCKHPGAPTWRLVGTSPVGTLCHKPSTVSGGGKSEISKSIDDAVIYGPIFVDDLQQDLDRVEEICRRDYSDRLRPEHAHEDRDPDRGILDPERSLGSVVKLLTPSSTFTDDYNAWLETIPHRIRALVFLVKRFHRPGWGRAWRKKFSVDVIDGQEGHQLKIFGRQVVASYLRVGLEEDGAWRIFKVRQDFIASEKIQMEDDITASVVVPAADLYGCAGALLAECMPERSLKLVENCESRLFQRPDEAVHRGFDKQSESDMARPGNFLANYEPLSGTPLARIVDDVMGFSEYTEPMRLLLQQAHESGAGYVVSSAHPRLVDGAPSKNPRYLQLRPDLANPVRRYLADLAVRLNHHIPLQQPVCHPVDAVLAGRRNNPPEEGIRGLAVYNPIHYQELPELFMDFICSLTGKSPSTTGAGSEGALTKGPFNALRTTADLNNALVSFILTGYAGFSSAAGHIGPDQRVDHDVSLLIPEIWARLPERKRDPAYLIKKGYLEPLQDFEHQGRKVPASRLGYRITEGFVHAYLGKIFDNSATVFDRAILRPETQGMDLFADGVHNIVEAQQRVARRYLEDGSVEEACPPLRALLHIMAEGHYRGKDAHHPEIRGLFTREYLLGSEWYLERLRTKQEREIALWERHVDYLGAFLEKESHADKAGQLGIQGRLEQAREQLEWVRGEAYLQSLQGTLGADPLRPAEAGNETGAVARKAA